jgi:hypothetical protein
MSPWTAAMPDKCTNIDQEKQISAACQRITSDYAALQRDILDARYFPGDAGYDNASATTEAQ